MNRNNYQFSNEPIFAQNLLKEYKSESEFSQFEESSENEVSVSYVKKDDPITKFKHDLKGFKAITPRKVIRRQTNVPHITESPRVRKEFKRDHTGNLDWVPKKKNKKIVVKMNAKLANKREIKKENSKKAERKDESALNLK